MRKVVFLLVVLVCAAAGFGQDVTQGSLLAIGKSGKELGLCPLRSTSVKTDISGFMARVRVQQEFVNTYGRPIEAVYVFPLSQNGAVDDMTMTVGDRVIRGKIMKREEARQTYETAKSQGKTASLLDQERENIFTQSVANIMPGEKVVIEISYVETLKYEDGAYEFVFPMTVAPRYIPGGVRDAAKISPPTAPTRGGHDISIEVNVNAGVPIEEVRSTSHRIDQANLSASSSKITLREGKVIPNKDFILRYDVTGKRIEDAVLTHRDERGGFLTLMLQPPDKIATEDRTPKEIVFVLDTSGSMEGFPIEKAKEAMRLSLEGLYPDDTFNLITFAGDTEILFPQPVPATKANLDRAQAFLAGREGSGGTEMMTAIKAALEPSDAQDHLRIVCFMTDGEIGNDDEIVAEVKRHPKARVFSFGIGSSVNRSLLDRVALEGKGEAEYVALEDDGSKAARKFYERVRSPLLTDLSIDWNGMPVTDVYPAKLTDLFSAKPVVLNARYTKSMSGTIKLRGKVAGMPYEREIAVNLPESDPANDVLSTLWARTRIADYTSQSLKAANSADSEAFEKQITDLGLEFRLLTAFTSFVAVEDKVVNENGKPATIQVPIEAPEGTTKSERYTNWNEGDVAYVTSGGGGGGRAVVPSTAKRPRNSGKGRKNYGMTAGVITGSGTGSGQGSGRGTGSGSGSGSGSGNAMVPSVGSTMSTSNAPAPPPMKAAAQETVNVTSDDTIKVETSQTVSATVNVQALQALPKGTNFTSLLTMSPGTVGRRGGGFQVDGSDSAENTFAIDGTEALKLRQPKANGEKDTELDENVSGKILYVQSPVYPQAARNAKALGKVVVDIRVDSDGHVFSAIAVSGPLVLRQSGVTAALATRFAPVMVDGRAMKFDGSIVYDFQSAGVIKLGLQNARIAPVTAEDKRLFASGEKLHFWLAAIVERLQTGNLKPGLNEAKFVAAGKATVQVELTERSAKALEKLKLAGFEVGIDNGKTTITGKIPLANIVSLAEIDEVKLVLPKI